MHIYQEDSICAMATAPGGAIAVIRVSGVDAAERCRNAWKSHTGKSVGELTARSLVLGTFGCKSVIDPSCLAVYMPGPHSYTGEDVVEFHCHGGAVCARTVLRELLAMGIRHAEPGEFSKRAFLNGRMDLTQAEAVSDMISAGSEAALAMAGRQLQGSIGRTVDEIASALDDIRAEVESRMDFPEEDLDWRSCDDLCSSLEKSVVELKELASTREQGELMRGGASLVIAGPPNAGKSSLLNRLLGRDRAIVSDIPGTTRDTVEASAQFRGIPFHLVDTAGIRKAGIDIIEKEGMERSVDAAEGADVVLWLYDASLPLEEQHRPNWKIRGTIVNVVNKTDMLSDAEKEQAVSLLPDAVFISARNGDGLEKLYDAMEEAVLHGRHLVNDVAVSARHGALLDEASEAVSKAIPFCREETWELMALHLRDAVSALGKITGRTFVPDVLDAIFAKFCIGK